MDQEDLFETLRPQPAEPEVLSVSELNRQIKGMIERKFGTAWVEGEISNYRPAASGHIYFTLKDDASQIPVAFFKGQQRGFRMRLSEGAKVKVYGDITLYLERGQHQIIARKVEEAGIGDLQKAFEALKEKLRAEGLFDEGRKRPLPFLPQHIGIVTSPTGAAVQDMLNILLRRFPNVHVVIAPVKVQGDGAAEEIARAMDLLNKRRDLDVLIIGRGGGSMEDLWAFNEEAVARAIARSRLPVISAVGHEIDFTISDFVADLRAPTPSAAAELVIRPKADLEEQVFGLQRRLRQALERKALRLKNRLVRAAHSYVFREPGNLLRQHRQSLHNTRLRLASSLRSEYVERQQRIDDAQGQLTRMIRMKTQHRTMMLEQLKAQLRSLNPRAVLARGYSITQTEDGRVVANVNDVAKGVKLVTLLNNGTVESTVEQIKKGKQS